MVRLPLLIGARPRFLVNQKGPLVPLGCGDWLIVSNHKDSHILIDCFINDKLVSHLIENFKLSLADGERAHVQVVIKEVGNESYLDIFAEKQK